MAEALAELEVHNISTAPKFGISYSSLKDAAASQAACQRLFEEMKDAVGQPSPTCSSPPTVAVYPLLVARCAVHSLQLWCLLRSMWAAGPNTVTAIWRGSILCVGDG